MNGDTRLISVVVCFNAQDDVLGIILDVQPRYTNATTARMMDRCFSLLLQTYLKTKSL